MIGAKLTHGKRGSPYKELVPGSLALFPQPLIRWIGEPVPTHNPAQHKPKQNAGCFVCFLPHSLCFELALLRTFISSVSDASLWNNNLWANVSTKYCGLLNNLRSYVIAASPVGVGRKILLPITLASRDECCTALSSRSHSHMLNFLRLPP